MCVAHSTLNSVTTLRSCLALSVCVVCADSDRLTGERIVTPEAFAMTMHEYITHHTVSREQHWKDLLNEGLDEEEPPGGVIYSTPSFRELDETLEAEKEGKSEWLPDQGTKVGEDVQDSCEIIVNHRELTHAHDNKADMHNKSLRCIFDDDSHSVRGA